MVLSFKCYHNLSLTECISGTNFVLTALVHEVPKLSVYVSSLERILVEAKQCHCQGAPLSQQQLSIFSFIYAYKNDNYHSKDMVRPVLFLEVIVLKTELMFSRYSDHMDEERREASRIDHVRRITNEMVFRRSIGLAATERSPFTED